MADDLSFELFIFYRYPISTIFHYRPYIGYVKSFVVRAVYVYG